MQRIVSLFALLAGLGITASASADSLSLEGVEVGAPGESNSVSLNYFSVSESDVVDILVSTDANWSSDDHINAQVYLFDMDGNVIATDLSFGGEAELSALLEAGTYLLAVGDFPMSSEEAWAGFNDPTWWESKGYFAFDGEYDVTVSAEDAKLAWAEGGPVSVPELNARGGAGSAFILFAGIALLSERRRRRTLA